MFIPNPGKFNKTFRPRNLQKLANFKLNRVVFGTYGLKAVESGWLKSANLETLRKYLGKSLKKEGKFWCRIFPNWTITSKPLEVRMGGGKGSVDFWVFPVKAGTILFEFSDVGLRKANELLNDCQNKSPVSLKLVKRF